MGVSRSATRLQHAAQMGQAGRHRSLTLCRPGCCWLECADGPPRWTRSRRRGIAKRDRRPSRVHGGVVVACWLRAVGAPPARKKASTRPRTLAGQRAMTSHAQRDGESTSRLHPSARRRDRSALAAMPPARLTANRFTDASEPSPMARSSRQTILPRALSGAALNFRLAGIMDSCGRSSGPDGALLPLRMWAAEGMAVDVDRAGPGRRRRLRDGEHAGDCPDGRPRPGGARGSPSGVSHCRLASLRRLGVPARVRLRARPRRTGPPAVALRFASADVRRTCAHRSPDRLRLDPRR